MSVKEQARDLIIGFEGIDQPGEWPGGDSGITIGYGYDIGYEPNFAADWAEHLTPETIAKLSAAVGVKGRAAQAIADQFDEIKIDEKASAEVLESASLPRYIKQAIGFAPGMVALPDAAQAALVSLVYNRGTSILGHTRTEMRAIRDALDAFYMPGRDEAPTRPLDWVLREIAYQIRLMVHLWDGIPDFPGKKEARIRGLIARREAEAKVVESCIGKESA